MRTQLLLSIAIAGSITAISCSSGPEQPRPGTPAYSWNAAKSAYRSGDFVKTNENLQQIVKTDSEFTARARPWAIILTAGLAQGYSDTAEAYDAGAKANRPNPMPFRKEANQVRSLASAAALELADGVHVFVEKDKAPNVTLAFELPAGNAAQPAAWRKVYAGAWIQDSEREAMLAAMLQRGVLLTASRAAGNPDDPAKSLETLKTGEAQRPRAEFLFAVAKMLYDQSDLFGSSKLDRPDRLRVMCQEALECLQAVPESKETKALTAKIQASLKKVGGGI